MWHLLANCSHVARQLQNDVSVDEQMRFRDWCISEIAYGMKKTTVAICEGEQVSDSELGPHKTRVLNSALQFADRGPERRDGVSRLARTTTGGSLAAEPTTHGTHADDPSERNIGTVCASCLVNQPAANILTTYQ